MRAFAMTLNLQDDPDKIARYKLHHQNVWPEVTAGLKSIGIKKMKIFLLGTRMFMYLEAPDDFDLATDFAKYQNSEKAVEWDALMRDFQEKSPEAGYDDWWAGMEEVFDLDWFPPEE